MLQQTSSYPLGEIGEPLRLAVERHGASILAVSDLGKLLREQGVKTTHEALVFTLCFPELYSALLAADIRFAAFLPCRIAVCNRGEGATVEALSPLEFCHLLHRADLDRLVLPLETALREIMDELHQHPAHPHAARTPAASTWAPQRTR
jgi:uncharacterized protein (DUF302 family)